MAYQPKTYRKFLATGVASAMVATAVAPAVSADEHVQFTDIENVSSWAGDAIAYLVEKGAIEGIGGNLYAPTEPLTRAQAATVLARTLDLEIDEDATTDFADLNGHWAEAYVAAVQSALPGVIDGYPDGTFAPNDNINRQEMSKITVEAFGLELDENADLSFDDNDSWGAEYVEVLASLGIIQGYGDGTVRPNADINRAEAAVFVHRTEVEDVRVDVPQREDVEVELAVADVYATGLKEVFVEFNQDVSDVEGADDEDNYEIEDGDITRAVVYGDTVRLVLDEPMSQQDEKTLTVSDDLLEEEEEFDVTFFDTTVPTADGVEAVGIRTLKVEFSEPIDADAFDEKTTAQKRQVFDIVDEDIFINNVTFHNNNREAHVTVFSDLPDGEHELKIEGGELKDYAGLTVRETTLDLVVVEDTDAPELVGYRDADQRSVTLIFDEPLVDDLDANDFYHTNTNSANRATDVDLDEDNPNEVHVEFDNGNLPEGTGMVYVASEAVEDLWGNKNEDRLSIQVTTEFDNEAPEIVSVTTKSGNQEFVVKFNEALNEDTAEDRRNFEIEDEDGDSVNITGASYDDDEHEVTLTVSEALFGDAVLTVDGVEDLVGNEMDEVEFAFTAEDKTRPVISNFTARAYDDNGERRLIINFGESMATSGTYSVLDLSKYHVDGYDLSDLEDFITIEATDNNRRAILTFDKEAYEDSDNATQGIIDDLFDTSNGSNEVIMTRVADAAGNTSTQISGSFTYDPAGVVGLDTTINGPARAVSSNTIELHLEDSLESFDIEDFIVYTGPAGAPVENLTEDVVNVALSSNGRVLTITLDPEEVSMDANATLNGEDVRVKTIDDSNYDIVSATQFGDELGISSTVIADRINPELDEDTEDNEATYSDQGGGYGLAEFDLDFTEIVKSQGNSASRAFAIGTDFTVQVDGEEFDLEDVQQGAGFAAGDFSGDNQFSLFFPNSYQSSTITVYVYGTDVQSDSVYNVSYSASNNFFRDLSENTVEDFSVEIETAE